MHKVVRSIIATQLMNEPNFISAMLKLLHRNQDNLNQLMSSQDRLSAIRCVALNA